MAEPMNMGTFAQWIAERQPVVQSLRAVAADRMVVLKWIDAQAGKEISLDDCTELNWMLKEADADWPDDSTNYLMNVELALTLINRLEIKMGQACEKVMIRQCVFGIKQLLDHDAAFGKDYNSKVEAYEDLGTWKFYVQAVDDQEMDATKPQTQPDGSVGSYRMRRKYVTWMRL